MDNDFFEVNIKVFNNQNLSMKAKGLYGLIKFHISNDEKINKQFLKENVSEGKSSFEATWLELKKQGFLIQEKYKNKETGHFNYEYRLNENIEPINKTNKKNKARSIRKALKGKRYNVLHRAGFKCQSCGEKPSADNDVLLEVDHIVPHSMGGSDNINNLQCLCRDCNNSKSNNYFNNHNKGWSV